VLVTQCGEIAGFFTDESGECLRPRKRWVALGVGRTFVGSGVHEIFRRLPYDARANA